MLDPGNRTCSKCYDDQDKWNIPIPNCLNPDGDGVVCPYPKLSTDLMQENMEAWVAWSKYADQLITIHVTMGGAMYTLSLDSLDRIMAYMEVVDRLGTFRKVRAIFNEWKKIQDTQSQTKTNQSMSKTKALRRSVDSGRS